MHPLGGELLARRPEPCRLSAALCIQYVAPLHTCRHPVVAAPAWRCSGVSRGASMAQASARRCLAALVPWDLPYCCVLHDMVRILNPSTPQLTIRSRSKRFSSVGFEYSHMGIS